MKRAALRSAGRPVACVLGEVDLVTALGLGGISSVVVAKAGNPARFSRYVKATIEWADPWRAPETLVERLLAFAHGQAEPPVLYFDGDWDLLLVSRYRDRLDPAFRFIVAEPDLVEAMVDKVRFQRLAEEVGLPVPRAVGVSPPGDATIAADLGFPLLVKPVTRQHELWQPIVRAKAVHVEDRDALRRVLEQFAGAAIDAIVQEVVPGPESRIESYHAYVDASGAIAGEFTGRKLRTFPRRYGYSTALTLTDSPDVLRLGRSVLRTLDLRGVAKLDFKRDATGRLHLLEVNPRFNLWHHLGALAGVNLPAIVYADLTGLPRPPAERGRASVRWCSLAHDFRAAREEGLSAARWATWAIRCEARSGLSLRDPFPLPAATLWRVGQWARRSRTRLDDPASSGHPRDER